MIPWFSNLKSEIDSRFRIFFIESAIKNGALHPLGQSRFQLSIANCRFIQALKRIENRQSEIDNALHSAPLRRPTSVMRNRRNIADRRHANTGVIDCADRRLTTATRTFDAQLALLHAASVALLAASYAACCAAKGVPLREPRNPRAPDDDCATMLPSRSVIEIIVLLNDAATYAIPTGIFFFSFLRKTFFFQPWLLLPYEITSYQAPSSSR